MRSNLPLTAPSATAEQLEVHQQIVAAVQSLAEPYRTTIYLRYYDDHPPAKIATLLGEPVKTIKTRLWRGLQQLRQQLAHSYGSRSAWLTAMVPAAASLGATSEVSSKAASGLLIMKAKHIAVLAISALALTVGAIYVLPLMLADPVAQPFGANAVVVPDAPSVSAPTAVAAERVVVTNGAPAQPLSPATPYGSLLVHVKWHDGTPANDVAISAQAKSEPQLDRNEQRAVSDSNGVVLITTLHAGAVTLSSDRGGTSKHEIVAGTQSEVDFVLPVGIDVEGEVVDARGHPVAQANVFLVAPRRGWLGGRALAKTDSSGKFRMRSVEPTWSLGARAGGFAPSELIDLETVQRAIDSTSVSVQLQLLHPGGNVAGVVVDESGKGITGALLVLGRSGRAHRLGPSSLVQEHWSPHVAVTNREGQFECNGVEPGQQAVVARANGFARTTSTVLSIAGQTQQLTITLSAHATVHGTVTDTAGKPVPNAIITVMENATETLSNDFGIRFETSELPRPQTRSDATGSFRLTGLAPGELHLIAAKQRDVTELEGSCRATLTARSNEDIPWDPVIEANKTMRVRVVDADGQQPWMGGALYAYAEQPAGKASSLHAFPVDHESNRGTFVFTGCADVPYTVTARRNRFGSPPQWVFLRGVRPGIDAELQLPRQQPEQPTGQVSGHVSDAGHRCENRPMRIALCTDSMVKHLEQSEGHFTTDEVPAGRYFIMVKASDEVVFLSDTFELLPAQRLDLGVLLTEPAASLRIALRTPDGAVLEAPRAYIGDGFRQRGMKWNGQALVADNLTVGQHKVRLAAPGWHAPPFDVNLVAGQDNTVTVDVVPGARRLLTVTFPYPDRWQAGHMEVRNQQGEVIAQYRNVKSHGIGVSSRSWYAHLPFERLSFEAVIDGARHRRELDLRSPPAPDEVHTFSLR